MAEAWTLLRSILKRSARALRAGADVTSRSSRKAALDRVEDIGAYAVLVDAAAQAEIERSITDLEEMNDSLPRGQDG